MADIPDAAVKAAAEAMLDAHDCEHLRTDPYMERCFPCDARLAVEAAAPVLAAQARREAAEHGLVVASVCGCGQPVGVCELCEGPRCWRCNPWFDPPRVPCGGCPACAGRIVGDADCYAASWRCDPAHHTPRAAVSESPPAPTPGHLQHPARPATSVTEAHNHNSEETA